MKRTTIDQDEQEDDSVVDSLFDSQLRAGVVEFLQHYAC